MKTVSSHEEIDLSAYIQPGDSVVCGQALAEPLLLTRALAEQRREIGPITLFLGAMFSSTFQPEHRDSIAFVAYCATGTNRGLSKAGCLEIVPTPYSQLSPLFDQERLPCDVALLQLADDGAGGFNLSLNKDYSLNAACKARVVLAEVVDGLPVVQGAELPANVRLDLVVRGGREVPASPRSTPGPEDRRIAERVAALIPDRATVEIGIGGLSESLLAALKGHKDLGFHSGVAGDGLVELVEAGVMTNAYKPRDRGVSLANMMIGGSRLYAFADRNPAFRLAGTEETHGPSVLGEIPNFHAANGCIEVDLTGQVNSEVAEGAYLGAAGGQLDFMRCAMNSPDGRSILMLSSTARKGAVSRIVPRIESGVVTAPRSEADLVVTEWGVAELRGTSLKERARRLAGIAHPDFREDLLRAAHPLAEA